MRNTGNAAKCSLVIHFDPRNSGTIRGVLPTLVKHTKASLFRLIPFLTSLCTTNHVFSYYFLNGTSKNEPVFA